MKEGLDKGYRKRAAQIDHLEDSANLKSVLFYESQKVLSELAPKYRIHNDNVVTLNAALKNALTNSMGSRPSSLRELMLETLRETMKGHGIEAPGFRDDYTQQLEERMKVRIA